MSLVHHVRRLLWKTGLDAVRFAPDRHPLARRRHLLRRYRIDTVLDVGANRGQFAGELRADLGYSGRILSFEPLPEAFERLRAAAGGDPSWEVYPFAIGEAEGEREIYVAGNSYSSSFLDILPAHLEAAPASAYRGRRTVRMRTLDAVFREHCADAKNVYLKADTQGYERRVLAGAEESLPAIGTVQLEMSLVPLYRGETLLLDLCRIMEEKGYTLVALENGISNPASGHLLQVDGIFRRLRAPVL
jgi:FkbM family methyltransferase